MIKNIFGRFASWTGFLAVLFASVFLYATISVPHFASTFNLSQAAAGVSEKAILLLPMALLIIAREIDLSVASILALSSVVLGVLIRAHMPLVGAVPIVLMAGAGAGALNGLLVTVLNLPSLLVTLGTMALFRGIGYIILGTHSVNELPDELTDFGINTVGPTAIPRTIVPFLLLAPLFATVLHYTALGRRIYAIGGNPDVALYTGIRVRGSASGFCRLRSYVAVAGSSSRPVYQMPERIMRSGFELDVVQITLLGGISCLWRPRQSDRVLRALGLVAIIRNVLGLNRSVAMGKESPSDCC